MVVFYLENALTILQEFASEIVANKCQYKSSPLFSTMDMLNNNILFVVVLCPS